MSANDVECPLPGYGPHPADSSPPRKDHPPRWVTGPVQDDKRWFFLEAFAGSAALSVAFQAAGANVLEPIELELNDFIAHPCDITSPLVLSKSLNWIVIGIH